MTGDRILAIDPGNTHSGWALIEVDGTIVDFDKSENEELLDYLWSGQLPQGRRCESVDPSWPDFGYPIPRDSCIEAVASYGMAVGASVFETCVWIGRFYEALAASCEKTPELVFRKDVKLHHCGVTRAKDANIRQALIDRFGAGASNGGKGSKASPGWFWGMTADVWQAYALAVYVADRDWNG